MRGEYLSSNTGIAYPFKNRHDVPEQIIHLFADACVYSASFDASLTSLRYSMATGILEFVVLGTTYSASLSRGQVYAVVSRGMSSFVIDMVYLDTLPDVEFEGNIAFEESCIVCPSDGITSIEIYNGDGDPRNAILTGDVAIEFGYNVECTESDGNITIDASPGTGIGKVPCNDECEDDPATNGEPIPTDNGNAVITGDDCYEITAKGSTIQIHGKCTACCQCQDYLDVVEVLKDVAGRVRDVKKDLTGDKTDAYFNIIEKQTLQIGRPDLDIQVDIAPDADLTSIATNGNIEEGFNEWQSVRVTATITNLSGVPCYIATPDYSWSSSEISAALRGWATSTTRVFGGKTVGVQECMRNGLFTAACFSNGYSTSGAFSVLSKNGRNSPEGWIAYSRSRGPSLRPRNLGSNDIKYTTPILERPTGLVQRIEDSISRSKSMTEGWAIQDLNNNANPSDMLGYADMLTHTLGGDSLGFVAPAGYSFTVSNAYVFPGAELDEKTRGRIKSVIAWFGCFAYAPMLGYSFAYNTAKSKLGKRTGKDGVEYYNTWEKGNMTVPDEMLYRPFMRWAAYDVGTGRQLYRGGEGEWK